MKYIIVMSYAVEPNSWKRIKIVIEKLRKNQKNP